MTTPVPDAQVFRPGLLDGQVALVTGGGTGIGFGIAELLAELGAHVVLASRKPENLEAGAAKIRAAGGQVSTVPVDVRDPERVRAMVEQVVGERGPHRPARQQRGGQLLRAERVALAQRVEERRRDRPVRHVLLLAGGGAGDEAAGWGRIVSISMTLHYRGWPQMAHATAAKAGVDALTRTLAVEWAPHGIRINAIAPGPIPTEGVRKAFTPPADSGIPDVFAAADAAMAKYAKKAIPLGRWGSPRDIANMVAFLASPAGDG
jgi:NAD(P)-dependent dehydrogenase (short-subunit alcohol dehydrogenase family)